MHMCAHTHDFIHIYIYVNTHMWFYACIHACTVLSCFRPVQLFVTLWTVAHQALLSMGFSRQEYWSGLSCLPSVDLPNLGIEVTSLMSPALAGRFFPTSATWETHIHVYVHR